jgi:hypothetical protein
VIAGHHHDPVGRGQRAGQLSEGGRKQGEPARIAPISDVAADDDGIQVASGAAQRQAERAQAAADQLGPSLPVAPADQVDLMVAEDVVAVETCQMQIRQVQDQRHR